MLGLAGIKDYIFGAIIVALIAYVSILKFNITQLEESNLGLNNRVAGFLAVAEAQREEAKEKVVTVIEKVEVIKWKTKTKIETIKEYVKDENKTDCSNAIGFARSYF